MCCDEMHTRVRQGALMRCPLCRADVQQRVCSPEVSFSMGGCSANKGW